MLQLTQEGNHTEINWKMFPEQDANLSTKICHKKANSAYKFPM